MRRLVIAGLAAMLACGTVQAQNEEVKPNTLKGLRELLENLGDDRTIEELSITIAPDGPQSAINEELESRTVDGGQTIIGFRNAGKCTLNPPNWSLIRDMGFYFIEFCDHPTKPNVAWGDFHLKAGSSGQLGGWTGSAEFICGNPPYHQLLTTNAKALFCHDS